MKRIRTAPMSAPAWGEVLVGIWKARAETEWAESKSKYWAEWLRENHAGAASAFTACARELSAALAKQPAASAVALTVCCGREECGGECGNEWRGMEWVRVTQQPAAVDGAMVERACRAHDRMYDHVGSDTRADMRERMYAALTAALAQQPAAVDEARPLDEWHEDNGPVVWWKFPVDEPAWIGTPLDSDWPGYHTHWTPHPAVPAIAKATGEQA